jgi:hypothetical protein
MYDQWELVSHCYLSGGDERGKHRHRLEPITSSHMLSRDGFLAEKTEER